MQQKVICQFRSRDGNVLYLFANDDATDARIDEISPIEHVTLHYGSYDDILGRFREMAEDAGGLGQTEVDRLEAFHQAAGYVEVAPEPEPEPIREEVYVEEHQVDERAPSGTRTDDEPRVRGFTPWRIFRQRN